MDIARSGYSVAQKVDFSVVEVAVSCGIVGRVPWKKVVDSWVGFFFSSRGHGNDWLIPAVVVVRGSMSEVCN